MASYRLEENSESETETAFLPNAEEYERQVLQLETSGKDAAAWKFLREFHTEQDANEWFKNRWYTRGHKQFADGLLLSLYCMQLESCPARMQAICRDGERSVFLYEDKLREHTCNFVNEENIEGSCDEEVDISEEIRKSRESADSGSNSHDSTPVISGNKEPGLSKESVGSQASNGVKKRFSRRLARKSDASSVSSTTEASPNVVPKAKRPRKKQSGAIPAPGRNGHQCDSSRVKTGDLDGWNNAGAIKHIESKYPITENVAGLSIEVLVGVAYHFGTMLWMVQFEGREEFSLVRSVVMNRHFPAKVISYYERRVTWKGQGKSDLELEVNLTLANPALELIESKCDCQTIPF